MNGLPNELIPDFHVPQTEESQIGDHRLSTSCVVVERPDHHCGDELVNLFPIRHAILIHYVHTGFVSKSVFMLKRLAKMY